MIGNLSFVKAAVAVVALCAVTGCARHGPDADFDRLVAQAEQRAKAGALTEADIQRLHSMLLDARVSYEESQRRADRVVQAIVNAGSCTWLDEFCRLNWDGAFGHFPTTAVWQFATRHPGVFFASLGEGQEFVDARLNPEQAFGTRAEVRKSIAALDAFAASAVPEQKDRAEEWSTALRDMLDSYP